MIKIAIVEDNKEDAKQFKEYIKQYQEEQKVIFDIKIFSSGIIFLEEYQGNFDIIFMDIDLPGQNGLETSKILRERDAKVVLIFLTNLAKYAIKGYSVNAFDFIAKPITYFSFSTMLKRALTKCSFEKGTDVTINNQGVIVKVDVDSILYIEVYNHRLIFHTDSGDFSEWKSLSSIENEYVSYGFAKGSASFLINLRRVKCIFGNQVSLDNGTPVYLSRSQKKLFAQKFSEFISGDGINHV
ncbi:MAG: LytTR family DNA-binding domain-containing protein [Bacilli bacterium]